MLLPRGMWQSHFGLPQLGKGGSALIGSYSVRVRGHSDKNQYRDSWHRNPVNASISEGGGSF